MTDSQTADTRKRKIENAPARKADRVKGEKYILNNEMRIWSGTRWHCEHSRVQFFCKECKGEGICQHEMIKHRCKNCNSVAMSEPLTEDTRKRKIEFAPTQQAKRIKGESYIHNNEVKIWHGKFWHCEHDRIRHDCALCKGAGICTHGKRRSRCEICGGNGLCEHKKLKEKCARCQGSQVCIHMRQKSTCRLCVGGGICLHGTRRSICVRCEGSQVCCHGRQKAQCRACLGVAFCLHGNRKYLCRLCQGPGLCIHNVARRNCRRCLGANYCQHETLKTRCRICSPDSKVFCTNCKYTIASVPHYEGHCRECYYQLHPDKPIPTRFMSKENHIHDYLREQFPDVTLLHNKTIQCGDSKRRPDWSIDCFKYVLVVECDEDSHRSYDSQCERKRMMQIFSDFNKRPIVFVRFNPDQFEGKSCFSFDQNNRLVVNDTWHTRKVVLKNAIQKHLDTAPQKECTIEYLFYKSHADIAPKSLSIN